MSRSAFISAGMAPRRLSSCGDTGETSAAGRNCDVYYEVSGEGEGEGEGDGGGAGEGEGEGAGGV